MDDLKIKRFRKLVNLAKRLGIGVELGKELNYFYDTKVKSNSFIFKKRIILDNNRFGREDDILTDRGLDQQTSGLAHELGHWLVAPPQRRKRKDYGIPIKAVNRQGKYLKWDLEDVKAQMVQRELLKFIGAETNKVPDDYETQLSDWWNSEGKVISKFAIDLVK